MINGSVSGNLGLKKEMINLGLYIGAEVNIPISSILFQG